jgi:hypothetical protein
MSKAMRPTFMVLLTVGLAVAASAQDEILPAPQTAEPATTEAPSAELIVPPEKSEVTEPSLSPGEEPLPPMDGKLPGEENIFGNDLFGGSDVLNPPPMPRIPDRPPVVEDPNEAERKMRVKFRQVKARIQNDPQLLELKDMAQHAPNPEDYRAARRSYYALLFGKVRKADSSLSSYADTLEKLAVADLYQTRIQPTVALNPAPAPQPEQKFVPGSEYPDAEPLSEKPVALP